MKNKELYDRTVDILVQAYFNDTLAHGDCHACAVGNLVAHNMGLKVMKLLMGYGWEGDGGVLYDVHWGLVFSTSPPYDQPSYPEGYMGRAKEEIDSTGYTWQELTKIEHAFETANKEDDYMFNGLMAVIEVLDQIHENADTNITSSSKQKFVKELI